MQVKCKDCDLIHEENERRIVWGNSQCGDYDVCPNCKCEEYEELTLKDKIIEIIGFGKEPERAELMAMQIEILIKEELINELKKQSKVTNDVVDRCFNVMGIK